MYVFYKRSMDTLFWDHRCYIFLESFRLYSLSTKVIFYPCSVLVFKVTFRECLPFIRNYFSTSYSNRYFLYV